MAAAAFCPRDGTPRVGGFRFCRSCGYDFDADSTAAAPAVPAVGVSPPQAPLGTYPVDRKAQMQVYRSSVGWSCLGRAMILGGALIGFVVAGTFAGSALSGPGNTLAELFVGFILGPVIGAAIGWWLWTALWGRS